MTRQPIAGLFALAILVLAAGAGAAHADQKDSRLPGLFDLLKSAPSGEAATPIEAEIWEIWVDSGDPEIDRLLAIGTAAMSAEEFAPALEAFNRIVELKPDFAEGWNKRATLYYLMGEFQKSLDDIDRTLKLEPRHFGALSGLGLVNMALDREEEAAKAYQRVLDIDPQSEDAQRNLAAINALLKRKSI